MALINAGDEVNEPAKSPSPIPLSTPEIHSSKTVKNPAKASKARTLLTKERPCFLKARKNPGPASRPTRNLSQRRSCGRSGAHVVAVAILAAVAAALGCSCGFTLPSLLLDEARVREKVARCSGRGIGIGSGSGSGSGRCDTDRTLGATNSTALCVSCMGEETRNAHGRWWHLGPRHSDPAPVVPALPRMSRQI